MYLNEFMHTLFAVAVSSKSRASLVNAVVKLRNSDEIIDPAWTTPRSTTPVTCGWLSVRSSTLESFQILLRVVIGSLNGQYSCQGNERHHSSTQRRKIDEFAVLQTLDHALPLDELLDEDYYECHLADEYSK
jgi:hypothetical protein